MQQPKISNFIVLTTQRTGSSWFMDLINSTERVEGHMELFLDQVRLKPAMAGENTFPRYIEFNYGYKIRPFSVFHYLNKFYSRPIASGFKLMYSHFRLYPEVLLYLVFSRVKIINLVRKNYLDIVISDAIAQQTGVSHASGDTDQGFNKIYLEPELTVKRIKKLHLNDLAIKILLKVFFWRYLEISYEELKKDNEKELNKVLNYIGADAVKKLSESGLVKRQINKKEEIIENYQEINKALSVAGLEKYLN